MQKKFGKIPAVLYPLGDGSIIERIYQQYNSNVDEIYVIAYKKQELIRDYIQFKRLPVNIIYLDQIKDLGYTILFGLDYVLKQYDKIDACFINFADTLIRDDLFDLQKDVAYYTKAIFEEEWTYFREEEGVITNIVDRSSSDIFESGGETTENLFVGVFQFLQPKILAACVRKAQNDTAINMDSFYKGLQDYSHLVPMKFLQTSNWLDVGHSENYFKAKKGVEARSFNYITIDEERGILIKRSENKEKLIHEILWYVKVPEKLQYLLPRIYDYSLSAESPFVSMEYYGYNTLHELLIYSEVPLLKWQMIFKKLLFAINEMESYKALGSQEEIHTALRSMYIDKTKNRLEELRLNANFSRFFSEDIIINGRQYRSLDGYLAVLPEFIEEIVISTFNGTFSIIHGDLCFSNILIEDNYGFMRFIDPRGQFGGFDIYGDARYEMAKLLHTVEGNYDLIIEDMFSVKVNSSNIDYEIPYKTTKILSVFKEVFAEKLTNYVALQLIEATLFLSMIPLHHNSLQRQYAMLAVGIQLFENVIQQWNGRIKSGKPINNSV